MSHPENELKQSPPACASLQYFSITLLFLVGASMGHCWWIGDHIALGSLTVLLIGGLVGYFSGLWRSVASSVGMFIGYQFSAPIASKLVPWLERQLSQAIDGNIGIAISGILGGLVATFVLLLVGAVLRRNARFKQFDRWAGGVVGVGIAAVCVAFTLWGLLASETKIQESRRIAMQNQTEANKNSPQQIAVLRLAAIMDSTKTSYVMLGLRSWNPFIDNAYFRNLKTQLESVQPRIGLGTHNDVGTLFQSLTKSGLGK